MSVSFAPPLSPQINANAHGAVKPLKPVPSKPPSTVNELLLQRAQEIPDRPLLATSSSEHEAGHFVQHTARELDRYADESAKGYTQLGLSLQGVSGESEVIALLGPSTLDYVVSMFALSRIGYTVLFLSTRLSTSAYVALLQKTHCTKIVTTARYQSTIEQIQRSYSVSGFPMLDDSVYRIGGPASGRFVRPRQIPNESDQVAFIVHSSGSTGLPKPIFQRHGSCLSNYAINTGMRAFITLPLYHNHGLSTFLRGVYAGVLTAFFNAGLPQTHDHLVQSMEAYKPESFHCVPYALKLLAENDRGIRALAECKLVLFGGSSCPDELGNRLVEAGVYLVGHYGATEMGQLMTSFRDPKSKEWDWVRPFSTVAPYLQFKKIGEGLFECVVLDGLKSKVLSNSDDPPNSFHTRDMFIAHPSIPNCWKYLGRLDDRVTLVNGEKVLPIPIEHHVRQSELVEETLVFGVGKAFPGLLIFPSGSSAGLSKIAILDRIAPLIHDANEHAEQFSQISLDMVRIMDLGTQYPRTDKGTIIRAAAYKAFEPEIEDIYRRFETYDADRDGALQNLDLDQMQTYLLELFSSTLQTQALTLDSDFFEAGADSLQTISCRAKIMRNLDLGGHTPRQNVVFEYPTVRKLALHLHALKTGAEVQPKEETDIMAELIQKYSVFPQFQAGNSVSEGEVVMLTGATGSLGAHVLSQLLALPNVKAVYCPVRASSRAVAQARVTASLEARQLLSPEFAAKAVCLPSDLGQETLGLDDEVLDHIRSNLTTVIHSAWAVNFNLGVGSFERQHIAGAYHLIKLCLSVSLKSPAQFFFISSISAAAATPIPATIEEGFIDDLRHAQNMGYARSKLVTEHIVRAAALSTGIHARALRCGQIIGDSRNGVWNSTEAIPLMLQSATTIRALPDIDETPSWIPVDLCASAILELCQITSSDVERTYADDASTVYHVQNPTLFSWTEDLLPVLRKSGLQFDTVSQREWIRRLREGEQDPVKNPTVKLIDFFADKYDHEGLGRRGLVFATLRTSQDSPTIRNGFDVIGSGIIDKCLRYWRPLWSQSGWNRSNLQI